MRTPASLKGSAAAGVRRWAPTQGQLAAHATVLSAQQSHRELSGQRQAVCALWHPAPHCAERKQSPPHLLIPPGGGGDHDLLPHLPGHPLLQHQGGAAGGGGLQGQGTGAGGGGRGRGGVAGSSGPGGRGWSEADVVGGACHVTPIRCLRGPMSPVPGGSRLAPAGRHVTLTCARRVQVGANCLPCSSSMPPLRTQMP